jgi:cytochrome c oxidase assembly factor CtaG
VLLSAALVTFAYFVAALFDRARVAGTGALFIYLLALIPGYIMPALQASRQWSLHRHPSPPARE